jgi:hypothetical protein
MRALVIFNRVFQIGTAIGGSIAVILTAGIGFLILGGALKRL